MKLLTLNTHSIIENNYTDKLNIFSDEIAKIKPDIIAMQEVNQTTYMPLISNELLNGYNKIETKIPIKEDNHIAAVNRILLSKGIEYNWIWLPIKLGYGKYDEGIAIMSLSPIDDIEIVTLSSDDSYNNWRTRMAIGIKSRNNEWYYSVHFGWWDDEIEPFYKQWERFENAVITKKDSWILGDFNTTPSDKSYSLVCKSGWFDSYRLADYSDEGFTVAKQIDGWTDFCEKRIDYIFSGRDRKIKSSEVIFNDTNKRVVSDHYGVIVEV